MSDAGRLNQLLDELNSAIGEITPYKLAVVDPAAVQPVERNAHFMPGKTYNRLVENISRDKNLSSLPFCWRRKDGIFVCLSGNHRVKAAVDAAVPLILVLYTDHELSKPERIAIQLSHNALVGQDNPAVLVELWQAVEALDLKVYTGIDDAYLKTLEPVQIAPLEDASLRLEKLTFLFLPAETERIPQVLREIGGLKEKRLAAPLDQWGRFFGTLLRYKEARNLEDVGEALLLLCDLAEAELKPKEAPVNAQPHPVPTPRT